MTDTKAQFKPLTITPVSFSLTEGTDIPAPPESPPQTPVKEKPSTATETTKASGDASANDDAVNTKPPTKDVSHLQSPPQSPTASKGPSGVRKFLSLRSMRRGGGVGNGGKASASTTDVTSVGSPPRTGAGSSRPGSPLTVLSAGGATTSTSATGQSLRRKRSGASWFGGGKRKSGMFFVGRVDEDHAAAEPGAERKVPRGPPPPAIPEFESLGAVLDGGSIGGGEMFKDIK